MGAAPVETAVVLDLEVVDAAVLWKDVLEGVL